MIRNSVLGSLTSLSIIHPTVIESSTLPLLFHSLPDNSPSLSETKLRDKYRSHLHSLSDLCVQPALFETLVIRILNKLDTVSATNITEDEQRECEVAYSYDLLDCLYGVIGKKVGEKHADVIKHFETVVPRLSGLVVEASMPRVGNMMPIWRDRRLLGLVGRMIDLLVWELPVE